MSLRADRPSLDETLHDAQNHCPTISQNLASENTVGSNGAPVPSTEVIQEFKVQTRQYELDEGTGAAARDAATEWRPKRESEELKKVQ